MMEFDAKQKVLIAVYAEYQKDLPNMKEEIKANKLGLSGEVFKVALRKLQNERLILGVNFAEGGGKLLSVYTDAIMMTREGISYVENKLTIDEVKSGREKLEELSKKSAGWLWGEAKDIISRTLSEIIQANIQNNN